MPHLANTWNSYVLFKDNCLFLPVGGMNKTQELLQKDDRVIVIIRTKELIGFNGARLGVKIEGKASFVEQGLVFDELKERFPWLRAVMRVQIINAHQAA